VEVVEEMEVLLEHQQMLVNLAVLVVEVDLLVALGQVEQEILHQSLHHKEIPEELVQHLQDLVLAAAEALVQQVEMVLVMLVEMVEMEHHLLFLDHQ
jgi:hypothetical protein